MAVDPHILQFYQRLVEQFGALPSPEDAIAQHIRFEAIATVSDRLDPDGVKVSDLSLPPIGRTSDAIAFRPKGVAMSCLLVWLRGGGWVVGAPRTTHRMLAVLLAQDTRCVVMSVGYRLAPEYAFPMPADDARDALVYLAEQRAHLGFAPDFIAVGGDSTGGHLAVQVAQGICPGLVNTQFLLYPVTIPAFGSESYNVFTQSLGLTCDEIRWYWEKYIGAEVLAKPLAEQDPRIFLTTRPPAYTPPDTVVIVVVHDVLHDDGLQYTDYLMQHGTQVITIETSDMTRAFVRIQLEAERAREWIRRAAHAFVGMISGE